MEIKDADYPLYNYDILSGCFVPKELHSFAELVYSLSAVDRFCLALLEASIQGVGWAVAATVQDMRVDHGRPHVLVAEQFLDHANGTSHARHRPSAKVRRGI